MQRFPHALIVLLLLVGAAAAAQTREEADFSLHFAPALSLPLGRDREAFLPGGSSRLLGRLKIAPFLFLEGGLEFAVAPVNVQPGEPVDRALLMLVTPRAGLSATFQILPRLSLGLNAHGGYYFAMLPEVTLEPSSGQNPAVSAGLALSYRLLPSLSLGIEAGYRNFLGLYNDLSAGLSLAYHFRSRAPSYLPEGLKPYKPLRIEPPALDAVFPVFYKYYDSHPIGRLRIRNEGKIPMEEIRISVFVNQYMDNPNLCREIEFLRGGQEEEIELFALFNNRVLEISEGEKVQVNITVESVVAGESYGNETVETLRLYDRNAITWVDDRRAAAFVTSKDPLVLRFAKNVSGMIKEEGGGALDPSLLSAIALHEALTLYGLSYVVDPSTPYIELSKNKEAVDYLQFPNQTFEYKAGDCDDLSILYCALLEAVGIETAFITVPAHIYMAFSLGMSPQEARQQFESVDELIFRDEGTWVPVEVTAIGEGFLRAWEIGARQWRESEPRGQAGFFPIREAWRLYEPVGFGGKLDTVQVPAQEQLLKRFREQVGRIVDRELSPQVSRLNRQISESGNDPRFINKLGILYARYGVMDKAKEQFRRILARQEYLAALSNLGNLVFLEGDYQQALSLYERAYRQSPDNARVLLGMARCNHELARYEIAQRHYGRLKAVDAALAGRFAYLEQRGGELGSARAAEAERLKEVMVWEGE